MDPNYHHYHGFPDSDRDRAKPLAAQEETRVYVNEDYLLTSPFVYGYSLSAKQWGQINVSQLSEIKFREDAYDKLVLDENEKQLMFALVSTQATGGTDLIDGKGGGCIFLLYGPPGCGKTLSAEAISEKEHRPLYMVSVGELGTDVDSLENNLREILDIATRWNAVVLLDEADIFLEARTDLDIHRNAMVGVFLRMLEYFPGIMFLTTNRASNLDEAFFSRISIAIGFQPLTESARAQVWTNLTKPEERAGLDIPALAKYRVNGRQIKNCINSARSLAGQAKRPVAQEDFIRVIKTAEKFEVAMAASRKAHGKKDSILEADVVEGAQVTEVATAQ